MEMVGPSTRATRERGQGPAVGGARSYVRVPEAATILCRFRVVMVCVPAEVVTVNATVYSPYVAVALAILPLVHALGMVTFSEAVLPAPTAAGEKVTPPAWYLSPRGSSHPP